MRWTTHRLLVLMAAALLAPGCGTGGRPLSTSREPAVPELELTWPQAPKRPRIRFLKAVAHPRDLGIQPSIWQRLGEFVAGKSEERFVRPTGVAVDGAVIYVADPGAQVLWILDTEAGRSRTIHNADRQRLISPVAVAAGRNRSVYLADSYLARVFAYDSEGKLTATIAGPDLRVPAGVAYDAMRDRLYVADSGAHTVWIFDADDKLAGKIGQRGIGQGEFNFPSHVAVDREGTLYVTDTLNFRLQMFSAAGAFIGQFGKHGHSSGEFAMPKGVAVDSAGHIYVAEALFDAVQIFDRQGRYLLSFGGRGVNAGQFWLPGGVFVGGRDRIYVADAYNRRIQIFEYLAGGDDE